MANDIGIIVVVYDEKYDDYDDLLNVFLILKDEDEEFIHS